MKSLKILIPVAAAILVLVAAAWAWQRLARPAESDFLVASGRIEGRITSLSARSAGRVMEIKADEGRTVERGGILVQLADPALHERINSMAARVRPFLLSVY